MRAQISASRPATRLAVRPTQVRFMSYMKIA
jgi:hypothetical protein